MLTLSIQQEIVGSKQLSPYSDLPGSPELHGISFLLFKRVNAAPPVCSRLKSLESSHLIVRARSLCLLRALEGDFLLDRYDALAAFVFSTAANWPMR